MRRQPLQPAGTETMRRQPLQPAGTETMRRHSLVGHSAKPGLSRKSLLRLEKKTTYGLCGRGHACGSDVGGESGTSLECPREASRLREEEESGALFSFLPVRRTGSSQQPSRFRTTTAQASNELVEAETGWLYRLCTVRKAHIFRRVTRGNSGNSGQRTQTPGNLEIPAAPTFHLPRKSACSE